MMTDSELEMGQYKNTWWVKVLGWVSVIVLTFLNMQGLPDQMTAFFSSNPTPVEQHLGAIVAYILDVLIIALLVWTIVELKRGNKRYKQQLAAQQEQVTAAKKNE